MGHGIFRSDKIGYRVGKSLILAIKLKFNGMWDSQKPPNGVSLVFNTQV